MPCFDVVLDEEVDASRFLEDDDILEILCNGGTSEAVQLSSLVELIFDALMMELEVLVLAIGRSDVTEIGDFEAFGFSV